VTEFFTIDLKDLDRIIQGLHADEGAAAEAMSRAIDATAKMAQRLGQATQTRGLAFDLALARRRLRMIKTSAGRANHGGGGSFGSKRARVRRLRQSAKLWFGLNPVDPTDLVPGVTGSDGGMVRGQHRTRLHAGKGVDLPADSFMGHGRNSGKALVFRRKGAARLPVQAVKWSPEAAALNLITGDVWPKVREYFYRSFEHNLSRVLEEG
jgi:hypothetical protein